MALLTRSLRASALSLVLHSFALAAIGSFYLAFFSSMSDLLSEKSAMMQAFSPGMLKALGMEDLSQGANYAQAAFLGLLGLVLLVAACTGWAAAVSAGPEETGELELTLAHAVTRRQVILERTLALLLRVIVLGAVALATIAAFNQWGGLDIPWKNLPAGIVSWMGLGLLCATAGIAAGAWTGRRVAAIGTGVGVAVVGYLLNAVGSQSPDYDVLLGVSPYAWAFRHTPLANGWDGTGLALLYGVSAVMLVIALVGITVRDIGR